MRSAYKRLPPELFATPGESSVGADAAAKTANTAEVIAVFDQLIDHSYAAELLEQRRTPT